VERAVRGLEFTDDIDPPSQQVLVLGQSGRALALTAPLVETSPGRCLNCGRVFLTTVAQRLCARCRAEAE
jgi:hypothetical protein